MLWYSPLFNYRSNKPLNKHTKQKKASTIADHKNHYTQRTITNRPNAQAATPWRIARAVASSLNPTQQT